LRRSAQAETYAGPALAQKASIPKPPNAVAIASEKDEKVKELLALMDTDKRGKISKQAWMNFMEAEFDRLDATKKGEIDPRELLKSTESIKHVRSLALGK
jgi:Ca2+-binding EF-hand superfamily protein